MKWEFIDIGGWSNCTEPLSEVTPKPPRTWYEIEAQLRAKEGVLWVEGAEPTIHPEFWRLITTGKPMWVRTNGRLFIYPEIAKKAALENVVYVVDIFGPKAIHEECTGGSFEQTIAGIRNLLKCNAKLIARIPIVKKNIQYLSETISLLTECGLQEIVLAVPEPRGPIAKQYNEVPSLASMQAFVHAAVEEVSFVVKLANTALCQIRDHEDHYFPLPVHEQKEKGKECVECIKNTACEGLFSEYLKQYGASEMKPIKEETKHKRVAPFFVSDDEMSVVLRCVQRPKTWWDVVFETGYPIPVLVQMIEVLKERGDLIEEGDFLRTAKVAQELRMVSEKIYGERVTENPNPAFTQLTVDAKDLSERVRYLVETIPSGGRIAVLGDDDFTSLALASTGRFEVTVFEIDERVCEKVRALAQELKLAVTVVQHDLRKPLPQKYLQTMDAFYTDSPYSLNGFTLFISRGISLLKNEAKKHGFASFSPEMPILEEVELPVQQAITKMGLFVEHKGFGGKNDIPKSLKEKYPTLESVRSALREWKKLPPQEEWFFAALGRKEFLFHFLTTAKTRPLIEGEYTEEIYYSSSPLKYYMDVKG